MQNYVAYAEFLVKVNGLESITDDVTKNEVINKTFYGDLEDTFYYKVRDMIIQSLVEGDKISYLNNLLSVTLGLSDDDTKYQTYRFEQDLALTSTSLNSYQTLKEIYINYKDAFTDARKNEVANNFLGVAINHGNIEDMKLVLSNLKAV